MAGKIAVLAVHGIGKHAAGETQNAMADLLLSLQAEEGEQRKRYSEFVGVDLQIPLEPLEIEPELRMEAQAGKKGWWHWLTQLYQERSADFADEAKVLAETRRSSLRRDGLDTREESTSRPALGYTKLLLDQYRGGADGNVYRTARLEGTRLAGKDVSRSSPTGNGDSGPPKSEGGSEWGTGWDDESSDAGAEPPADGAPTPDRDVHIYEVLWSDLAQPYNSFITFFLALFQLILHLASLSRLTIDSGAGEGSGAAWELYRRVQRYAVRILQIFIPLFEVILLIALAACLIEVWSATSGHAWVMFALSAAGALGIGVAVIRDAKRTVVEHYLVWALKAMSPAAIGLAVAAALWFGWVDRPGTVVDLIAGKADIAGAVLFWLLPGSFCLWWVLSKYEDQRKGVLATGFALYAASFILFCVFLAQAYAHRATNVEMKTVLEATLKTGLFLLAAVRLSWLLMVICAFAAFVLGMVAWRGTPKGAARGRARAAVRTSRLALALPAVSFFLVTILIWAAFLGATRKLMPPGSSYFAQDVIDRVHLPAWTVSTPVIESLFPPEELKKPNIDYQEPPKNKDGRLTNNYALRVFAWTMGYHLPLVLAVLSVSIFLLVWWTLPSILTEAVTPRGTPGPPRTSTDIRSLRMGTWMSRGLDATDVVTLLLWGAIFLVPLLYILGSHAHGSIRGRTLEEILGPITFVVILNTLTIGLPVLAALAARGQTILSTILDVDTYLRTSPTNATPRAKIFERYISTLRFLWSYRDEAGDPYDEIVIFAHSLGALISGDLLFYLESTKVEPRFNAISNQKITLFTVGNPVRQLLNRFFPYLYGWVRPDPDNGNVHLPAPLPSGVDPVIGDTQTPDPRQLGLKRWVNAYRSGDYVGRSLWLDEWYVRPQFSSNPVVAHSPDGLRHEMCIGAGAHTRYMDDTAPDIAWMLDSLITLP